MTPIEAIHERARAKRRRILLPEGDDPRIREGARCAREAGLADVVLFGGTDVARETGCETINLAALDRAPHAAAYHDLRRHKGVSEAQAAEMVENPLMLAALMVRMGKADGTLAGAAHTTADTVRAAIHVIGPAEDVSTVSSFFLMVLPASDAEGPRAVIFSDCGLVVEPSAGELAEIALASAVSWTQFTGEAPRVAMLSFSTLGSARHARVSHVTRALQLVRERKPDLVASGELQFDAAFVPEIAASKAGNEEMQGDANVFVFPNLDAGNIGYKIAERIGRARALGPILQGLAHPANDLSRGCSAQDVADMIAVTALQVT